MIVGVMRIMERSGDQASAGRARSIELPAADASGAVHFSADIAAAAWHKSSRSSLNGSCVEVAELLDERVCVRDTKAAGAGPVLAFTCAEWTRFLTRVKRDELRLG